MTNTVQDYIESPVEEDDDVFDGYGIIIHPKKADTYVKGTNFPTVVETLERIGVVYDRSVKSIVQTCHILHRRGQYAILHYKELIAMDGGEDRVNENDRRARNHIVGLLYQWGIIDLDDDMKVEMIDEGLSGAGIRVIPFKEKDEWTLTQKYTIGKPRT